MVHIKIDSMHLSGRKSSPVRYHRISLAEPPEIGSFGAFGDENPVMEWNQARDKFHLLLFQHDGVFSLNGTLTPFRHGALFVVPPGARCRVEGFGTSEYIHCFISMYAHDSGKDVFLVPFFTQFTRAEADVWEYTLRAALRRMVVSQTSKYAVTWNLLWRVAQPMSAVDANPFIELSMKWVEEHIQEKISIAELARAMDISHNQLIRHFRQELGITPIQYVRQRRAEVARELLTHSTKPIKTIAHLVGVPDLHAFNRLIRECLGMSPRQVRRARKELDYFRARDFEPPRTS